MKKLWLVTLIALTCLVGNAESGKKEFKEIKVKGLATLIKSQKNLLIFDANTETTRSNVGIIPKAILLDSASQYDVAKYLPQDKSTPLVFYCANTFCTASHDAAKRATEHGYKNVSVMVDGIFGWRDAKQPLEPVSGADKERVPQSAKEIEPKEVFQKLKDKAAVVLDVREAEERFEIIENSLWFPMSKVKDAKAWAEFKQKLNPKVPTIVYCAAGGRSPKVAQKLADEGYSSLYFKGPDQWKAEGLPVVNGPAKN